MEPRAIRMFGLSAGNSVIVDVWEFEFDCRTPEIPSTKYGFDHLFIEKWDVKRYRVFHGKYFWMEGTPKCGRNHVGLSGGVRNQYVALDQCFKLVFQMLDKNSLKF